MEKRVKILYIVTIIAILAFLGMQIFWLYDRYKFSLNEYDDYAFRSIIEAVDELNEGRSERPVTVAGSELQHSHNYNISHHKDSLGRKMITATITSQKYYAHKLLGINDQRELTDEEKKRAALMVLENGTLAETRRQVFDVSSAISDASIWGAFEHSTTEFLTPLTIGMVDSALMTHGLHADIRLIVTDTMTWQPTSIRRPSAFSPVAEIAVPYSELERKSVVVTYRIPVAQVFHSMAGSLLAVAVLSLFLIICLVLQITTILKLSRLDKMRNSFITTMIHELKRPLSTLKMCVSGLDNDRMLDDKAIRKELLTASRTSLDNLSAYFSKLRDITFNKVEQIPLNIRTVNLHDLFDDVTAAIVQPSGKTVAIHNKIDPGTIVSADYSHLYNILNNLVENAVKYSGPEVEINATASVRDNIVEFSISDNGSGISSRDLKYIFRRFYRGKASSGEQPGMGLGLAYVKLLIDAHGGDISVGSTEGKGTCFTIKLPQ